MVETKRWVVRIDYKILNNPTSNVIIIPAENYGHAKHKIEEKYNSKGMQLIMIKSLREINI